MNSPPDPDDVAGYDYTLPEHLIASMPPERREQSRMLVLDRGTGEMLHRSVSDLPEFLRPGDCLVLNDTRVIPARLFGVREETGGRWEGLFLGVDPAGRWRVLGQTRGKLRAGEAIVVHPAHQPDSPERLRLVLVEKEPEEGIWAVRPEAEVEPLAALERFGTVPLPPYIRRKLAAAGDWERYQTTYAREPGAVAAPTAGLHLTPELLNRCRQQGAECASVTLHVGIGTFRPISVDRLSEHRMHAEWCRLPEETAEKLRETRARGGRIVAIGTTSVRTLESAAAGKPVAESWSGETRLFIRPPYQFRSVDVLFTNFHLPKSTLLVLVSTFAGREWTLSAYEEAIRSGYRFYSYGDAMLII